METRIIIVYGNVSYPRARIILSMDVLIDMAEALAKKKRIRAGHKASATKLLHQIDGAASAPSPDTAKLRSLKMSLTEKLETLKQLDGEIVELIDDETSLASKIEQADDFKAGLYSSMIRNIEPCPSRSAHSTSDSASSRSLGRSEPSGRLCEAAKANDTSI